MKYIQYYFVSAFVFFVGFMLVVGIIKLFELAFASSASIAVFLFGGFFFWIAIFLMDVVWKKLKLHQLRKNAERREALDANDREIEKYVLSVKKAKTSKEIDELERRFKGAI